MPLKVAGDFFQPGDLDQKIGQLVRALAQGGDPCQQGRVIFEKIGVMHAYHPGAGAGRQNHKVERFEFGEEFLRHRLGRFAVARVVAGLAAAGLLFRHDDLATGRFQQLDRGKADTWAHGVNQASDEKSYAHRFLQMVRRNNAHNLATRKLLFTRCRYRHQVDG